MGVKFDGFDIDLSAFLPTLARDLFREQIAQFDARELNNGRSMPGSITLKDTGKLRGSFRFETSKERISVTLWNAAPYAGYVNARYPFLGLSPQRLEAVQQRLSAIASVLAKAVEL